MIRAVPLLLFASFMGGLLAADEKEDVIFRSDVSLVRVDAQVVDRENRAITGLREEDFILREEGRPQQIRHFESENMPVDVLLLLDVSASMRPHVERIASAAHQALAVLGKDDRVAIMVFDRSSRLRLPFRNGRGDIEREFERLLRQESFNGGTDITRGLLDAANYIAVNGRREARRAIVILTDDQTERDRDEERVGRALVRADAVLSLLLAPDAMQNRDWGRGRHGGGGGYPGGSGYPGGGWPGGPLGGIILGRRGPYGGQGPYGGGGGGPVIMGSHTQSAGTAEIARRSGGDSLDVDDASALETTLARIRQRYALHFHLPEGVQPGQERNIEVELAQSARQRYHDAEVRFRRAYFAPGGPSDSGSAPPEPVVVSRAPEQSSDSEPEQPPVLRRRPARRHAPVDEPSGPSGPVITDSATASGAPEQDAPASRRGGWRRADPSRADPSSQQPAPPETVNSAPQQDTPRGWRRLKPGGQP